jgi:hypothetical protein
MNDPLPYVAAPVDDILRQSSARLSHRDWNIRNPAGRALPSLTRGSSATTPAPGSERS